jgi:hypothetical protein
VVPESLTVNPETDVEKIIRLTYFDVCSGRNFPARLPDPLDVKKTDVFLVLFLAVKVNCLSLPYVTVRF